MLNMEMGEVTEVSPRSRYSGTRGTILPNISRTDTSVHFFRRTSDGDAIHVEIKHARP
jgi:hypothetical protein